MGYKLDRRMRLVMEPQFENLYPWAILEVDADGRKLGGDQVPWSWSVYFSATELMLSDELKIEKAGEFEGRLPQREEYSQRRLIRAKLRLGDSRNDVDPRPPTLSMFGADRAINTFGLDIRPLGSEDETEVCSAWGTPAYQDRDYGEDECVIFYLELKPSTFASLVQRIVDGTADEVVLAVGRVSGFYAHWSERNTSTGAIKVLTRVTEQAVKVDPGIKLAPPRLGAVGEVALYVNARSELLKKPIIQSPDGDEDEAMPPIRSAATVATLAAVHPAASELLQSLQGSARWIIGLLAILVVSVLLKP